MASGGARLLDGARGAIVSVSSERSIGFACAQAARAHGAEVAIASRPDRQRTTAELAARLGSTSIALELDDEASIAAAFAALERAFGRLDFLVHTLMRVPAELLARPLLEVSYADFARVMQIGVHSLIVLARHARPLLARSTAPRLIALSSACARRATPHYHVAGIAKAALESAVIYLAAELGPSGILVNAVSPGLVATDGAAQVIGEGAAAATRAHMARRSATRRAVELDEVAECVAWLASPHARQIAGEVITVDAGYARSYF
jgi:enoyl-[acyl-carrier protein] reductase I